MVQCNMLYHNGGSRQTDTNGTIILGSYTSIVNQTGIDVTDNFYKYMENKGDKLAQVYFTALGRERYSMYKTNNNPEVLKTKFGIPN